MRAAVARPGNAELLVAGAEFALCYLGAKSMGLPDLLRGSARPRSRDDNALDEIRTPSRLVAADPGG